MAGAHCRAVLTIATTRNSKNTRFEQKMATNLILHNKFPALSERDQLFIERADLATTLSESRLCNYQVGRQSYAILEIKDPINIRNYTLLSEDCIHNPEVSNRAFRSTTMPTA